MESLTRRHPWTYQTISEDTKDAIEKAMSRDMQSSAESRKKNGYVDIEQDVKSWSDDLSGVRPGRSIEDVERELLNDLFRTLKPESSPIGKLKRLLKSNRVPKEVTPQEVLHATTSADADEGTIDPITNRRVTKQASATTSAKTSLSNSSSFTPKFEDVDHHPNLQSNPSPSSAILSSGPKDDADDYGPVKWNEPDGLQKATPGEESKKYKDLDKYSQTGIDDPNAPQKLTPEEKSKLYTDLGNYKAVTWSEPDGLQKTTPEELSKKYDDLYSYKAVRWNEPDGLRKLTLEELSKEYGDLDKYGAIRWNEPDGLRKFTPEELSKSYSDLGEYEPVKWDEPDGLRRLTPEEKSKEYDDLQAYDGPRTVKESVIEAHETSQMDPTPKGKPLAAKVKVAHEDPGKEYKDLGEYGPVYWNEPDGLRKLTPEELSKNYDDLRLYGAVKWNEPDGLRILTPEEKSKQYEDVKEYAPKETTGTEVVPVRRHPEEASKDYDDLESYGPVRWNEPDGLRKLTPEEESKNYSDLSEYSAVKDGQPRRHPEEASKDYNDLDKYSPGQFDAANRKYPVHPEEASKQYDDLGSYATSSQGQAATSTGSDTGSSGLPAGSSGGNDGDNSDPTESLSADKIRANVLRRARYLSQQKTLEEAQDHYRGLWDPIMKEGYELLEKDKVNGNLSDNNVRDFPEEFSTSLNSGKSPSKSTLEDAKDHYQGHWDPIMTQAYEILEKDKANPPRNLSGNYARDFPEEFSTSWNTGNSPSKSTLYPKNKAVEAQSNENMPREEAEASSMDESFPTETSRLEPALNRQARRRTSRLDAAQRAQFNHDPYSKTPQGLETSYVEECGGAPTWPTLVKHYGHKSAKDSKETAAASATGAGQAQSYKILAYDPTTDSIRAADTSSAVHDTSSPLTPADIVPRLSSPAKFFPHLSALEAEGYEMISGHGDVLVFRKVRPASPDASSSVTDAGPVRYPPVNPIDMMGKPVTGNFASPTGFVNYDTLPDEDSYKPAPPFRSNIDVRREEPVFSGAQEAESSPSTKKKRGLGKRMVIGTAWVAGGAYAVGVTAEYFATAGGRPRGHVRDQTCGR